MNQKQKQELTLRVPLDRPPTPKDRVNRLGLAEFMEFLFKNGWADENGNALKDFTLSQAGHAEGGEYYIEWKAKLHP